MIVRFIAIFAFYQLLFAVLTAIMYLLGVPLSVWAYVIASAFAAMVAFIVANTTISSR